VSELFIEIQIEPLAEGGYLATSEDLQGLLAQGRTVAETIEIAQDVARKLIESYLEHGDPLPEKIQAALTHQEVKITTTIPVGIAMEAIAA
jgi:antitoxin HicB